MDPDTLSRKQKKNALRATNLIKEKRSGVVKGRAVADGGPQRACIPREEATSPTVSTKSLMASLVINAFEERDVATFDVPRARLNADMPSGKFVPLKLEGELVDIVCKVNPECKEDARHGHGKKAPHLSILKALCGCVESALSWCEMRVSTLKDMGFVINPRVTSALQTRTQMKNSALSSGMQTTTSSPTLTRKLQPRSSKTSRSTAVISSSREERNASSWA